MNAKYGAATPNELAGKCLLGRADRVAATVADALQGAGIEPRLAGGVVRRSEIVSTVDVVCGAEPEPLWDATQRIRGVRLDGSRGDNPVLASVEGVRIRLVAVPTDRVETVAHHLTGPPAYIEALRARARTRGLELTPMGFQAGLDGEGVDSGANGECAIYERLDLPWIPPELRTDAGTIEMAATGLPRLVAHADVRGDLHMHTTWSDGAATLQRMVQTAQARGYEYVAITDHSQALRIANGLDGRALRAQAKEIASVQEAVPSIRILKGCEVDILPDGTLDLEDDVLARLDLVLASVHSSFNMSAKDMTRRIVKALENPHVHVLCHPTGRKLGRRRPYPLNLGEVLDAAAALGVAVEVNGNPARLDLDYRGLRMCARLGVKVVASSDAHSAARLDNIRYGIDQARRAGLQPNQIVNAGTLDQVLGWLATRGRR